MSSPIDRSYIHTGPWKNYSEIASIGATITLTTRDAAFLLALLAIIVTVAGSSIWRIVRYFSHQARSNPNLQHDAVFIQQQAILRNATSALSAAWAFARLSYSWRKHQRTSRSSHTFLFLAVSIIIFTAFAVASIFSTRVTAARGVTFLLHSPNCGYWNSSFASSTLEAVRVLNVTYAGSAYAKNCYDNDSSSASCGTFVKPRISWTSNNDAPCPFAAKSCSSTARPYEIDTGPMDSHSTLGLNAKPSERVTLRKLATCAKVNGSTYASNKNETTRSGTDNFVQVLMGPTRLSSGDVVTNYTYEYNEHTASVGVGYGLHIINWTPISDFNRTDADSTMFFLTTNGVENNDPVTDPLFTATRAINQTLNNGDVVTKYVSSAYMSAMGCIEQIQMCNPSKSPSLCTPLVKFDDLGDYLDKIDLNELQYATATTMRVASVQAKLWAAVNGRDGSSLKAQSTVLALAQQAALPPNQWQLELDGWFATSLAVLQQQIVEIATGPTNFMDHSVIAAPSDKYEREICARQMVRNAGGYQNFSTLGVSLIIGLGSLLVIVGAYIDSIWGLIQTHALKKRYTSYGRLAWESDGYLQLQRMAQESAGHDNWVNCDGPIPVLRNLESDAQRVSVLDVSDRQHPRLSQARQEMLYRDGALEDPVRSKLLDAESP
ncbi:hypothetical protein LAWI1_G005934 [Lachnellula willkommii]|uniref:Uncharacterized protein n=1 Tax=Lachnellula willkommii TaxID=215461 RepID=A0A559M8J0_9HELO|nr:hypothetical protein LAWI1_G005934 [Lachnellula willkommii]